MRFSVSYKVPELPLSYRMKVYGVIKEAINRVNKEYYDEIFNVKSRKIKPFSFSVFLHNYEIKGEKIFLDKITITISTPDMEFAIYAMNGIQMIKEIEIDGVIWNRESIRMLKEAKIVGQKALFTTLNSILVEDKNGKPLSPLDEDYERELNYYANLQIQQYTGRSLYKEIKFTPIKMKKMIVKERNRYLQGDQQLIFTTYKGTFMLEGSQEDLQLLYQLGLGKRTTYFGMLDYEGKGV